MEIIHVSVSEKRILKPKRPLQNANTTEVNTIKKCLFGVPDAQDIENLLHEQIKEDWERIKNRFGIDMEDVENMENARKEVHTPKKRKCDGSNGKRTKSTKRRRLFHHQQDNKITDFYQVRKTVPHEKKDL